ncbi:hypothetical protein LZ575_05730 [Antarcticibacterium sp. 1MA-6-2]|uniref:hypothetical protein n=1 Tax=Antarcticibacterium sp. 1MA-6-2 TaxID=2908210 RepID=UPI001F491C99|nr:hypothetical protein [Antarcticibacterium sp. 1MA-6-2]UJH92099.1 hypothetical protein LZ575_05730 [Antarcticibacterium sp. 1MA-6-2]
MKTSNIILTAFCILFIAYIFGIAAEIRFRGEKKERFFDPNSQELQVGCSSNFRKDIPLPSFKILKIKKISQVGNITFSAQASNTFSVFAESEIELPELEYHVSGDTLIIDRMNKPGLCNQFKMELVESKTKIIVDTMSINLYSTLDSLKGLELKGMNASFHFSGNGTNLKVIDSLLVDLKYDSSIYSHSVISIKHVAGEIQNNSRIELWNSKVESGQVQIGGNSTITIDANHYNNPDPSVQLIYQKIKP